MAATEQPLQLRLYSAAELAEATAGFSYHCLIGSGGFGNVFRGMLSLTPVAIKVLDHEGLQGLREFHNEMSLLATLEHPHIVRLLGYAAEQPQPSSSRPTVPLGQLSPSPLTPGPRGIQALVYELMTRGNLEEMLASKSAAVPWMWQMRIRTAAQTACALAFLHGKGIVHRDIKPANIFLTADLHAKLGDIGLAAMDSLYGTLPGGPSDAASDEAVGTWQYLAPEYKAGSGAGGCTSMRTDTYAYGLTLLQLLNGCPSPRDLVRKAQAALEGAQLMTLFMDVTAGPWDPRTAERAVKLALWCCMHDAEQRPAMAVVHAELQRLADQCRPA